MATTPRKLSVCFYLVNQMSIDVYQRCFGTVAVSPDDMVLPDLQQVWWEVH